MSDVSDILENAALDLRQINQDELADILTLLTQLVTLELIAAARGAIVTILTP